eukprot:910037_1
MIDPSISLHQQMQHFIVVSLPHVTQTHHIQEEPTHSITQKNKSWSNSSHASKRNKFHRTHQNEMNFNAPKHDNTQHQSARVNIKRNQRDETDAIGTDHIA